MCTPYDARDQRTSPHEPCLLVIAGPNHRYPYRVTDVARAWSTARGSILTPHSLNRKEAGRRYGFRRARRSVIAYSRAARAPAKRKIIAVWA